MASMIFTTVVRTFLRAVIRASSDLIKFSARFIESNLDVEPVHVHANTMLQSSVNQSPISLDFAGKFLEEIDLIMEKILSENPNRQEIENKLFLESAIPRPLRKAIYTVTERLIGSQSPLEIQAVIFWDTKWLGFSAVQTPARQYPDIPPHAHVWDTLRKQKLSPGPVKKCNRCGILSAMDDPPIVQDLLRKLLAANPGVQRNWTALIQRNCLCFGSWSSTELK
jgi:Mediator complex subunit 16, C-terminal